MSVQGYTSYTLPCSERALPSPPLHLMARARNRSTHTRQCPPHDGSACGGPLCIFTYPNAIEVQTDRFKLPINLNDSIGVRQCALCARNEHELLRCPPRKVSSPSVSVRSSWCLVTPEECTPVGYEPLEYQYVFLPVTDAATSALSSTINPPFPL